MDVTTGAGDMASTQTVLHYENPFFAVGIVVPGLAATPNVPAPPADFTVLQYIIIGVFTEEVLMQIDTPAQLLRTGVVAPDQQTVYVVDSGRQSIGSGLQGQLFRMFSLLLSVDTAFVVR